MQEQMTAGALKLAERGLVPDAMLRAGIRALLRKRRRSLGGKIVAKAGALAEDFLQTLDQAPLAPVPEAANAQHYELPVDFFRTVLGPHRKYSCAWWPAGVDSLEAAEAAALAETCRRAQLDNGQEILELGCGWGSLSLWMARNYPQARITAVSNSHTQREAILALASDQGLENLRVVTADINVFEPGTRFDRIVSVEMFEHLRNWPAMFGRISRWLRPEGRFFLHVFVHGGAPYPFAEDDASDWMSRHFFTGGMMPSDDLAVRLQDDLRLLQRWRWDGRHYQRTAEAWLQRMDKQRAAIEPMLRAAYGEDSERWRMRWRMFFLAVAELFGADNGQQWWVSHYLFEPRRVAQPHEAGASA
jgi:cyclopropane-fatty-acyl-phospholipid synthase